MNSLDINELKKIELKILDEIDEICQSNNIRYSLCAGTLLGAVRHQGFIPWDDDIDIMLPRPDYKKFIDYCQNHSTSFRLISNETHSNYGDFVAKAYDPTTYVIENSRNVKNYGIGVWVDIFPIDGIGDTPVKALRNLKSTSFLRSLLIAKNWVRFERSTTRPWYIEPIRFMFFLMSRFVSSRLIITLIKNKYKEFPFELQNYAGCLFGAYREKEIFPIDIFDNYSKIQFENSKYSCIDRYDDYLSSLYGDYMKLPPEDKRHTHHNFKAYYKDG